MTRSRLFALTPKDVSGGKFSTVSWSVISQDELLKVIVSKFEDILKFVCSSLELSCNISGGVVPISFGLEKIADKNGIKVKSDEVLLIL